MPINFENLKLSYFKLSARQLAKFFEIFNFYIIIIFMVEMVKGSAERSPNLVILFIVNGDHVDHEFFS